MTADIIFSILNLLLSITAIWIAITSSRKTAKDTTKQIESIKQLSRIQIETSIKQLDTEIRKISFAPNKPRRNGMVFRQ